MASSPCPHGMPTFGSCFECMEEGNLPPAPKPKRSWGVPFPARYRGWCRICGDEIEPGDLIAWDATLERYGCGNCAEANR